MNAAIDEFTNWILIERGLSRATWSAYRDDLYRFDRFLLQGGTSSLNEVTREQIVDFLLAEQKRGCGVATISRRLVAIKVLFAYLFREGLLGNNVTESMDSPRLWKALPSVLSVRDVDALLRSGGKKTPYAVRDRAFLELLYASGLRVSEAIDLRMQDIHIDDGYLRCRGKGKKVRVVPFGRRASLWLQRYLNEGRPRLVNQNEVDTVFLSRLGKALSRKTMWQIIRKRAVLAGIDKPVSPHTLRHSFASHLLSNGAPLRVIQEMLGHADIGTTQVYTHVDRGQLRLIHQRFHPRG